MRFCHMEHFYTLTIFLKHKQINCFLTIYLDPMKTIVTIMCDNSDFRKTAKFYCFLRSF